MNWITKYRNWQEKYANWKATYANWKAHGLIGLTIMIYPIWFWLLPDIWEYWQGMCACKEACQEECPMGSTYDILPLLAPPLPIILLMAWWASILLSREIQTPHEQPRHLIKSSNLKDPEKTPELPESRYEDLSLLRRRRILIIDEHWFVSSTPVMLEESSADSTTPATTNLTNGNKPEDR